MHKTVLIQLWQDKGYPQKFNVAKIIVFYENKHNFFSFFLNLLNQYWRSIFRNFGKWYFFIKTSQDFAIQ